MLRKDWQWACLPSGWPGSGSPRKAGQPVSLLSHGLALRRGGKETISWSLWVPEKKDLNPFMLEPTSPASSTGETSWRSGGRRVGLPALPEQAGSRDHWAEEWAVTCPCSFLETTMFVLAREQLTNCWKWKQTVRRKTGVKSKDFLALGLIFPIVFQDGHSSQLQPLESCSLGREYNASSLS